MSYIIGWKNSRSVFLSGDTLASANFNMNIYEEQTSFGENLTKSKCKYHSEAFLKIWVINKLAVGFVSFDTYEAIEFLENLQSEIDETNIFQSIDTLTKKYQPKKSDFLFAFHEKGENKLIKYDKEYGEVSEERDPTQIGSLPSDYMDQTNEFCFHAIDEEDRINDDDTLVLVNSTHQNLMIVQNSMRFDVGGLFTGLYVNKNGITWQKDTFFLNYNVNLEALNENESNLKDIFTPSSQVQLLVRQNCASYSSGFQNKTDKSGDLFKCWISRKTNLLPESIIAERVKLDLECSDEVYGRFKCPNPKFILLFSNDPNISRSCVIIRSNNGNPYVKIPCRENDQFNIQVNLSIFTALKPDREMNIYRYEFFN